MTRDASLRLVLRAIAIAIAIVAAIDPVLTSNRSSRPDVSVIAVDPHRDSALAENVARSLNGSFVVTPAPLATAAATVLVGDALPEARSDLVQPIFAVTPDRHNRSITIESVQAPASVPLEARVPVTVAVRVTGAKNSELIVTLREDVTLRSSGAVVDRATRPITSDDQRSALTLTFAPSNGGAGLQLSAEIVTNGAVTDSAHADALLAVHDTLPVLFYEPRPSWQSTFVRRAAEADSRISVTSRTTTSRNISTSSGKAPAALDNLGAIDQYDAIIVGAPDALSERDVAGLESFMRRRGGTVVLLLDSVAAGPWQRLAGNASWLTNGSGRIVRVAHDTTAPAIRASELAWPAHLPLGAEPLAISFPARGDPPAQHPVVWRSPVGAGALIVSGALDSWRYRDSTVSAFDHFWRDLIVAAASAAIPPVSITLSNSIVAPSELVEVTVDVRDAALRPLPTRTSVQAFVHRLIDGEPSSVRLWPDAEPGVFHGTFRAPSDCKACTLDLDVMVDGKTQGEAMFWVMAGAIHPHADASDLLATWAASHGGRAFTAAELKSLAGALRQAIHATPRPTRWHPMRSIWWLLPFVLALSSEWWMRRRRGLA